MSHFLVLAWERSEQERMEDCLQDLAEDDKEPFYRGDKDEVTNDIV